MKRAALVLVCLAGCGGPKMGPHDLPHFQAGDSAMVVSPDNRLAMLRPIKMPETGHGKDGKPDSIDLWHASCFLEAGTMVRIEDDPPGTEIPNAPDASSRDVRVVVLDGKCKGRIGFLYRNDLRSAPAPTP